MDPWPVTEWDEWEDHLFDTPVRQPYARVTWQGRVLASRQILTLRELALATHGAYLHDTRRRMEAELLRELHHTPRMRSTNGT